MDDRRRRFETQALPHLDAAYNLARWLTRSSAEADDVVQDAMLRAFRAFDTFRGSDVKPWLLAIVRNCYLTKLRDRRTKLDMPLPEAESEYGNAFVVANADPETIVAAAAIGAPIGTVMSRLARARALLKDKWLEHTQGGSDGLP